MTDEARAFYERGLRLYADKDYAAAVGEFQAGYAVEPRREFLFAEAQAKRLSGDCAGAVGLYQKFLETQPSPAQVNATQMGLARCAQQMAATPAPAAAPLLEAQPPVATAPRATCRRRLRGPRRRRRPGFRPGIATRPGRRCSAPVC